MYICFIDDLIVVRIQRQILKRDLAMFGIFKKKSEKEKIQDQYEKLLREAFVLSRSNRRVSDQKIFEANEMMKQLGQLG